MTTPEKEKFRQVSEPLTCQQALNILQYSDDADQLMTDEKSDAFALHIAECRACANAFCHSVGMNNEGVFTSEYEACLTKVRHYLMSDEGVFRDFCNKCPEFARSYEKSLLADVSRGNQSAFDNLYRLFENELLSYLGRRYGSLGHEMIEEVANEAWSRIWFRRNTLNSIRQFSTYLKTIARSIIARRWRDHRKEDGPLLFEPSTAIPTPAESLIAQEISDKISEALSQLSKSLDQVFELNQIGLSAKEISAELGCTENAARRRHQKAREQLVKALSCCGDSCTVHHQRREGCPAEKDGVYCLKYLYFKQIELFRKKR